MSRSYLLCCLLLLSILFKPCLYLDGFSATTVAFRWKHPAMTFKEGIVHSQFTIGSPQSYICDKEYFTGKMLHQYNVHVA